MLSTPPAPKQKSEHRKCIWKQDYLSLLVAYCIPSLQQIHHYQLSNACMKPHTVTNSVTQHLLSPADIPWDKKACVALRALQIFRDSHNIFPDLEIAAL